MTRLPQSRRKRAQRGKLVDVAVGEASRSGFPAEIAMKDYRLVGHGGRYRLHSVTLIRPAGGKYSAGSPANGLARRIRGALRPPDPMPDLRRRLRELRGA